MDDTSKLEEIKNKSILKLAKSSGLISLAYIIYALNTKLIDGNT